MEMMVVLAIIGVLTLVVVVGQSSFNQSFLLTDTAYTVAFSVREAQSLGLSSRASGTATNAGYGVHFETVDPTSYLIFADVNPVVPGDGRGGVCAGHTFLTPPDAKPGNCTYSSDVAHPNDSTYSDQVIQTYKLNRGFKVSSFCGSAGGTSYCSGSGASPLTAMDIVFLRPNTQSIIIGTTGVSYVLLTDATLRISDPSGAKDKCIYVTQVGQVAVLGKGETHCP